MKEKNLTNQPKFPKCEQNLMKSDIKKKRSRERPDLRVALGIEPEVLPRLLPGRCLSNLRCRRGCGRLLRRLAGGEVISRETRIASATRRGTVVLVRRVRVVLRNDGRHGARNGAVIR